MPSRNFKSLGVRAGTHQALLGLSLRLSADLGRRVTPSDVIAALLVVAEQRPAEVATALQQTERLI